MIKVNIQRNKHNETITRFTVTGHAGYDDPGKDIVCAGVSAVTVGTVNAVESLTETNVSIAEVAESGLLKATVPQAVPQADHDKIQLLLESMVVMLQTIEQAYGSFIAIQQRYE